MVSRRAADVERIYTRTVGKVQQDTGRPSRGALHEDCTSFLDTCVDKCPDIMPARQCVESLSISVHRTIQIPRSVCWYVIRLPRGT